MPCRLRIGCIPYLNLLPFYYGQELSVQPYVQAPPRELGRLVAKGDVDAAPLAVVDTWRWQRELRPLDSFGLACAGPVESVLVFSRNPLGSLGGKLVRLTPESSTSVMLLKVLLQERYRLERVRFEVGGGDGDAFLVIGDAALEMAENPPPSHPHVIDLGTEWMEWTGTPFVFARWVVRRSCGEAGIRELEELLAAQLAANLGDLDRLARKGRLALTPERVKRYLRRFHYRLTDGDLEGAKLFRSKVISNGLGE